MPLPFRYPQVFTNYNYFIRITAYLNIERVTAESLTNPAQCNSWAFIPLFVSCMRCLTLIMTGWILIHFGKVQIMFKRLYLPTCMVTGTTAPALCYRSFWFGTGTSDVRYRNIALSKRYVNETSPKVPTPLVHFIGHRTIHRVRVKTRYDMPACTPNIVALRLVVW